MATAGKHRWDPKDSIVFAHAACLALGVGMVFWGIAPALVERLVTGRPADLSMFLFNSTAFALGGAFIGLHALVRRGRRWAVWTAFTLSALLSATGLILTIIVGAQLTSSFLLVLSGSTCFATWLAIGTPSEHAGRAKPEPAAVTHESKRPLDR